MSNESNYVSGVKGESLAKKYLLDAGMTLLAERYRAGRGQVDLIMQDDDVIAMIEVKYRPGSRHGDGLMAVTPAKQKRLLSAAMAFLQNRDSFDCQIRFDVMQITSDGIVYVKDAFRPQMY